MQATNFEKRFEKLLKRLSVEETKKQMWDCIYQVRRVGVLPKTCEQLEFDESENREELIPDLIEIATDLLGLAEGGKNGLATQIECIEYSYAELLKVDFPVLTDDEVPLVFAVLAFLKGTARSSVTDLTLRGFRQIIGEAAKMGMDQEVLK